MTEVSVIMPNYNGSAYIAQAIESVVKQDFQDWELLICDDCSTDNSIEIISNYLNDPRIKLLRKNTNMGVAHARNHAIAEAKGRYIAFLDHDDFWYEHKLSIQLEYMRRNKLDISYTNFDLMPEGEQKLFLIRSPKTIDYKKLLKGYRFGINTLIMSSAVISGTPFKQQEMEDFIFYLEVLKKGHIAYGIDSTQACTRLCKKSRSSNKLLMICTMWKIFRRNEKMNFFKAAYYFSFYIAVMLKKYARLLLKVTRLR